jgi:hypothetical protein
MIEDVAEGVRGNVDILQVPKECRTLYLLKLIFMVFETGLRCILVSEKQMESVSVSSF